VFPWSWWVVAALPSKPPLPAVLNHTIREFNNAVRKDIRFDATKMDGRCTEGIAPKKSNWADTIDQPPYWAYAVTGGITFTFGGLQINTDAEVLNTANSPIRGLFASGDIVAVFSQLSALHWTDTQCRVFAIGWWKRSGVGAVAPSTRSAACARIHVLFRWQLHKKAAIAGVARKTATKFSAEPAAGSAFCAGFSLLLRCRAE
jgi:hypothetical protein